MSTDTKDAAAMLDAMLDALATRLAPKLASPTAPRWEALARVAERIGITERSLADAGRRGEFATAIVGKQTVVCTEEVERWIEARARSRAANDIVDPYAASSAATPRARRR